MLEMLKRLCAARGVSGDEEEVAELLVELCTPLADSVERDALGNVIAFKKGYSGEKTVLVDAHMDEVGLYVNSIGDDGMIRFVSLGIDPRVINGRRVLVGANRVLGVVGVKPIHLQSAEERRVAPPVERQYIDIGAKDSAEARKHVKVGDTVVFESEFVEFGDGFIKARALDNRLGCAIVLEAMNQKPYYNTYFLFSVLEESGGHGARVATQAIKPDIAVVIDTTSAADHIEKPLQARAAILGAGTVIFLMESTTYYNPSSVQKVKEIANASEVKYQHKSVTLGGLNSGSIQRTAGGVETVAIATPCRYIHSGACTVKLSDVEETRKLMAALLASERL